MALFNKQYVCSKCGVSICPHCRETYVHKCKYEAYELVHTELIVGKGLSMLNILSYQAQYALQI